MFLDSFRNSRFSLFTLFFLFLLSNIIEAQDKKPKVALVLSGGGAKGIAHIPLLQKLDSLGIVPDMIIGTSMGSVVGGLYAMGYSGDSIASIANNLEWEELFKNEIAYNDVGVEEKSEYNKYLVDLDIIEGKPKAAPSLLKDQHLRELLATLTYSVYNINDFDELSIPFRSVAVDIVNEKEVIIGEGALNTAMRASMSIPGIFEPVSYKNTLLVDGGMMNNFPTDIAKNMGADIIIGSDVSGGSNPIEKLDNFASIISQAIMMSHHKKYPTNRGFVDVMIDHVPHLSYATQDFGKSKEIFEEGKVATLNSIISLSALAGKDGQSEPPKTDESEHSKLSA